ncbi:MAG: methyl-accepting chemotaxis protein [Candidatus Omnitrophota bacterium]|nr:MAG: methyl-accepting chemotaxis protein [Candidatus Omnitrophota bacterium]
MKAIKRRRYLVNKKFQFRYIALIVIPLILLLVGLYYLIYYSVFSEILIPEALATTLLPAMAKVNIIIAFTAPILLIIIFRMAFKYSNRIIGPIPRIERELEKAITGDFSVRVKARDKDELYSFINKINMLLEKIDSHQKL